MSAEGLSDEEIKDRIVAIFSILVADLDPDQLSDYLIEGFVITSVQWQEIFHRRHAKQGRCRELLNLLLTTKNPKAFSVFVQALERNAHWQWILDLLCQQKLLKETESTESDNLRWDSDRRLEEARLKWAKEKEELQEKLEEARLKWTKEKEELQEKLEEARLKWTKEKEDLLERQKQLQEQVDELLQRVEELEELRDMEANVQDLETETARNFEKMSVSRISIRSRRSLGRPYVRGRVRLKLVYSPNLQQLRVTILECNGLAPADKRNKRSDPYVKLYVLPDDDKLTKTKTAVKYNTLNPTYVETFKYPLSFSEDVTYTLWISVWHKFKLRRKKCLGEIFILLDEDLGNEIDDWYYLEKKRS